MKKKFIKQLLFPLLLLLTFIIFVIFLFVYRRDERLYTELTAELLKNQIRNQQVQRISVLGFQLIGVNF